MPRGPNWQQESVAAVTDKLQQLHGTLPADQQSVLEAVLAQAAQSSPTQSHLEGAEPVDHLRRRSDRPYPHLAQPGGPGQSQPPAHPAWARPACHQRLTTPLPHRR